MNDDAAKAVFLAGLPTGDKGELVPGHTGWDDLGPKAKERYRRMATAATKGNVGGADDFALEARSVGGGGFEYRLVSPWASPDLT